MACEILSTPGAVFALWGKPTMADFDHVKAALQVAADKHGEPVVYITRVPVKAPPPDSAARARLDELMPSIMGLCSSYHVVLEGEGFGAALKRGILTGMFQLNWRCKTFYVHANVHEVVGSVSPEHGAAVAKILEAARHRGLLSGPPPTSLPP